MNRMSTSVTKAVCIGSPLIFAGGTIAVLGHVDALTRAWYYATLTYDLVAFAMLLSGIAVLSLPYVARSVRWTMPFLSTLAVAGMLFACANVLTLHLQSTDGLLRLLGIHTSRWAHLRTAFGFPMTVFDNGGQSYLPSVNVLSATIDIIVAFCISWFLASWCDNHLRTWRESQQRCAACSYPRGTSARCKCGSQLSPK